MISFYKCDLRNACLHAFNLHAWGSTFEASDGMHNLGVHREDKLEILPDGSPRYTQEAYFVTHSRKLASCRDMHSSLPQPMHASPSLGVPSAQGAH
jgi:hypothetical protein